MSPHPALRTVLVVDDSEIACEAVKHTLGGAGIAVLTLTSPFGFIKTIRDERPALILIDVGLGVLNGAKLVQLAKKNAEAGCPVLLYSSRDAKLLQEDTASSGADGYITKSTTGRAFVDAVLGWLERARRQRP
jgi:DNA-binding response OmpR family regulator